MRFSITFLLFFVLNLSFQGIGYSQVSIGAYTGYASLKTAGDTSPWGFYDLKGGMLVGLRVDIPLSSSIKLSMLPSIAQYRGRIMIYDLQNEPIDSMKVKYNNLLLPLGITITTPKDRFYVFGGVEFHFPISMKGYGFGKTVDFSKYLRNYNLAVQFSAGYKVPIGRPLLYFELGYIQGIMKLGEKDGQWETEALRIRVRDIRFLIGVLVPLGKKTNTG